MKPSGSSKNPGLVRQQKNRGAYVRDLALDEALEIYAMRAIIDEAVARASWPSASRRFSSRCCARWSTRLIGWSGVGNADEYHLLNLAFHDRLIELSGNRKLHAVYRRLINELSLFLAPQSG